ncbi:hypothetical protein Glove_116g28 [Diversispora epigaea]|uniref:Uncharacterized protein n=1 Tax=Diversispora epigaea TaxID=1348612 RepID=A0A397J0X7_9GLOM|nr:hypothetical protein Glove_116g28 [Diversispora epigaea]
MSFLRAGCKLTFNNYKLFFVKSDEVVFKIPENPCSLNWTLTIVCEFERSLLNNMAVNEKNTFSQRVCDVGQENFFVSIPYTQLGRMSFLRAGCKLTFNNYKLFFVKSDEVVFKIPENPCSLNWTLTIVCEFERSLLNNMAVNEKNTFSQRVCDVGQENFVTNLSNKDIFKTCYIQII